MGHFYLILGLKDLLTFFLKSTPRNFFKFNKTIRQCKKTQMAIVNILKTSGWPRNETFLSHIGPKTSTDVFLDFVQW